MSNNIYFDNASTTRMHDNVISGLVEIMNELVANPSSLHQQGKNAKKIINNSREAIAKYINTTSNNIIFTSSGTESNNLAINSIKNNSKKTILTTKIEHDSIINTLEYLKYYNFNIQYVEVNKYGIVDLNDLKQKLNDDVCLVTLSMVNSVVGSINPIEEICQIIKSKDENIIIHIDAVQALGTTNINIEKLNIDFMSFSAHKIHGPKGIGVLYAKKTNIINPQIYGGHQEFGLRAGTENIYGIYGFQIAVQSIDKNFSNIKSMKEYIISNLKLYFNVVVHSNDFCVDNIINISIINVPSEYLVYSLSKQGIYISSSFACSNSEDNYSKVVYEISKDLELAKSSIRISLSKYNTLEECKIFIDVCRKCIDDYYLMHDMIK